MKMKFLLPILAISALLASCNSNTKHASDGFIKEIAELAEKPINLFDATRSGENGSDLNMDIFNDMISYAIELSEKYNLAEIVANSGYYSTPIDESMLHADFYEILYYFESNSTSEFYECIKNMLVDLKSLDNDKIVNSKTLLPNEQLALIMMNNSIEWAENTTRGPVDDCRDAYNAHMKQCKKWLYIGSGLTIIFIPLPALSTAFGVGTAIDYALCTDRASTNLMDCLDMLKE